MITDQYFPGNPVLVLSVVFLNHSFATQSPIKGLCLRTHLLLESTSDCLSAHMPLLPRTRIAVWIRLRVTLMLVSLQQQP